MDSNRANWNYTNMPDDLAVHVTFIVWGIIQSFHKNIFSICAEAPPCVSYSMLSPASTSLYALSRQARFYAKWFIVCAKESGNLCVAIHCSYMQIKHPLPSSGTLNKNATTTLTTSLLWESWYRHRVLKSTNFWKFIDIQQWAYQNPPGNKWWSHQFSGVSWNWVFIMATTHVVFSLCTLRSQFINSDRYLWLQVPAWVRDFKYIYPFLCLVLLILLVYFQIWLPLEKPLWSPRLIQCQDVKAINNKISTWKYLWQLKTYIPCLKNAMSVKF